MYHPDIDLPALVTEEAFVDLYEPKGLLRVDLDTEIAARVVDHPVTNATDLTAQEVAAYLEHQRRSEAAQKAAATRAESKPAPAKKASAANSEQSRED
jgi:sRNA-binding protein